jgi:hypothetical protein
MGRGAERRDVSRWLVKIAFCLGLGVAAAACGSSNTGSPAAPGNPSTMQAVPSANGAAGGAALPGAPLQATVSGPNPTSTGIGGTNAGAAGTSGVVGTVKQVTQTGTPMPCNVATAVATNCQTCHGATPIGGAPMSLMTYDDFHAQAKTMPSLKVYQLAQMRINATAKPMPPGGSLPQADHTALDTWFTAGALAGADADKTCAAPVTQTGTDLLQPVPDMSPLVAGPGETCYDLKVHQSTTSVDDTPYTVDTGEHYEQFYFNVPWKAGDIGTRFGAKFDNLKVLHHWLLFTTATTNAEGFHETVIGTQLGDAAELLAGWAVGGWNVTMPADVGFDLPAPGTGTMLNLQWHFFNSTGMTEQDATAVQVCTMAAGSRPKLGNITWLGTEYFNGPFGMPAGQKSDWSGTCTPSRTGMNDTDPIHIFFFWPHMHFLGINMKSEVTHAGATTEVFNKPFDFSHQVHYAASVDLAPGDTITSTCTFNNTTDANVAFGPSTTQEMCYQFAFSYPAHALENGVISLIGASNTCW